MALRSVDLPHPTGPTTMVILARGTVILTDCSRPSGCFSLSQPKNPFSITIAWELFGVISRISRENLLFCDEVEPLSDAYPRSSSEPRDGRAGNLRLSFLRSVDRNSCIRRKLPTPPMKLESDMISEPSGSDRRVKSDKEVNTFAVSSVVLPLLRARMEKTAKVKMGATTGERYAVGS